MSVTASSFHLSDATKPSQTGMTRRWYLDKRHCPPGRPKLQCSYSCGFLIR
ncbi:hypothetical protein [Wolbachia pipientis]